MAAEQAQAWYAYALVDGPPSAEQISALGIHDQPLHVVDYQDLGAVVSPVDLDEFGEQGLKTHLEDLAWLEQVATAHDRVTRAAAGTVATAPLRLATVFRSEESVRARLAEWHDRARAVFERITGRSEWSVKVYTVPEAQKPTSTERPSSGRDYLQRRRQANNERVHAAEVDQEWVQSLHERLHGLAVASRLLAAQDRTLSGYTGEMLLNAAYLVENDDAEGFAETVKSTEGGGRLRLSIDGPWAPYSFATLEAEP